MKNNIFYKIVIINQILLILLLYIIIGNNRYILNKNKIIKGLQMNEIKKNILSNKIKLDYEINEFAIIRINCKYCGLFVFYYLYLGCIVSYIKEGYIPIVDLISFPNIFNRFNSSSLNINPWELFFKQPYGYTLEEVKKNSIHIKYINCQRYIKPNKETIYINKVFNGFLA